jgi:hypothetical protein
MLDSRIIDLAQVEPCVVNKRKALDFAIKYAAMRKSGGLCPYCGVQLEFEHEHGTRVAFDHIIPISRGGADDLSNLIACCFSCNAAKHAKTAFEYICEREGIAVHWFARFNPEMDGFSVADNSYDLADKGAWLSCWGEVFDGQDDDCSYDALEEIEHQERMQDFYRTLVADMAKLEEEACDGC